MRDGGRGVARGFLNGWVYTWLLLAVIGFRHTYNWDPTSPFVTSNLVHIWFLASVLLGTYASLSAWWQATAERNPWQLLTLGQALGWALGHFVYVLIVIGFYIGVLMGMLFALEGTIQSYAIAVGNSSTALQFVPLGPDTMPYLLLATFFVVAIAQTLIVGTSMARWFIKGLDSWLKLDA